MNQSTSTIDEEGRCPLHPVMQLQSRKKNGEWRVLMSACPLCISGLPATGQSVVLPSLDRRNNSSPDAAGLDDDDNNEAEEDGKEGPSPSMRENGFDERGHSSKPSASGRHKKGDKTKHGGEGNMRSGAPKKERMQPQEQQQQQASPHPSPQQKPLNSSITESHLPEVSSFDSGEATEDEDITSWTPNVKDNYQEFHNFLQADQQKLIGSDNNNNAHSPKSITRSPRPSPEAVRQHYSPLQHLNAGRSFPPPLYGKSLQNGPPHAQQSNHITMTKKQPMVQDPSNYRPPPPKRPDPESVDSRPALSSSIRQHQQQQQQQKQPSHLRPTYPPTNRTLPTMPMTPPKQPPPRTPSPYTTKPLEQDEVSAVSMNSVTRNLYKSIGSSRSDDSEEDDEEEEEESVSSKSTFQGSTKNVMHTDQYDAKGRCVRHPTVRLRKKKLFGGWAVVLSNCPECCLDEMRRVKDERSRGGGSHKHGSKRGGGSKCGSSRGGNSRADSKGESKASSGLSKEKKLKKKKKKEKRDGESTNPPMTQINVGSRSGSRRGGEEDDKSIGTASTITISSSTLASGGRYNRNWQDFVSAEDEEDGNDAPSTARVTRMPYTDHHGERGWYTGSVDGTTGIPHGYGTMNFSNGAVFEGQWRNGVSVTPSVTREEPILIRNSPGNSMRSSGQPLPAHLRRPTFHHHPPPPRSALETHYEDDGRSRSTSRSRSTLRSRSTSGSRAVPPPHHHHRSHSITHNRFTINIER
eukprot:CCRYP_000942-RA/>CCRYP_000942-RA protein AED:0.20 eAED:0.20 QI:0/-1/0/1/-1/1/1/0/746